MSDNLYETPGATGPDFGSQMDPLGTANQQAFGQPAPSVEPAAGFGAAPANASIGAPAASVKIGKTATTKKKLSTGKKVLYGAGGILFTFFGLIIALDPGPQKINASPTPSGTPPAAAAEQMGAPGAAGDAATVMGGAPVPAAADGAAGAQAAFVETPAPPAPATAQAAPGAAQVQPAPAPAAVQPAAPAPAAVAAAAPAPASHPVQPAAPKPVPAPPEKLVMAQEKVPAVAASPDELASRVATLEKRLARYEREEARQRAQAAKAATQTRTVARVQAPAPMPVPTATATYRPVSASPAVEMRRPAVLSGDGVRVIGVSTRHGVTTALVEFGGVKQRVAAGEAIPGLGIVRSVAVDAAGNPVVEVNGVRYQ